MVPGYGSLGYILSLCKTLGSIPVVYWLLWHMIFFNFFVLVEIWTQGLLTELHPQPFLNVLLILRQDLTKSINCLTGLKFGILLPQSPTVLRLQVYPATFSDWLFLIQAFLPLRSFIQEGRGFSSVACISACLASARSWVQFLVPKRKETFSNKQKARNSAPVQ